MKKWNSINNKPFKSYQLEAITYEIFKNRKINALDKGLIIFFNFGIKFLKEGKQIYDDMDKHPLLKGINRKSAINLMNKSLLKMQ